MIYVPFLENVDYLHLRKPDYIKNKKILLVKYNKLCNIIFLLKNIISMSNSVDHDQRLKIKAEILCLKQNY